MSYVAGVRVGLNTSQTWNEEQMRIENTRTKVFVVIMDSPSAEEDDVAAVPGVPYIGSFDTIAGGFCKSREFNEVAPAVWEVTVEYDNTFKQPENTDPNNPDPWDMSPQWSWSSETIDVPIVKDAITGDAITSSAWEPLPPITAPMTIPVLTIRKALATFDEGDIQEYTNKTNSQAFWGWSMDKAYMFSINASPEKQGNTKFWRVEYVIKFKQDKWTVELLDQGTYYRDPLTLDKIPFGDAAFQQVTGNLDGTGFRNDTGTPAFVGPFNTVTRKDFNILGLGPYLWI